MPDSNEGVIENAASEPAPQETVKNEESSSANNSGETATPSEEKLLKQSEVNKVVGGAKAEAYERGRREALAIAKAQADKEAVKPIVADKKVTLSEDELYKLVESHSEDLAARKRANEVASQFVGKMQAGMQKHKDFESVVGVLDIPNLPGTMIDFANSMDNTADVMYELGKNPSKFASVLMLSHSNPGMAKKEFEKLSNSIKRNQEALENEAKTKVNEPLNQIKPSIAGTDSGECKTISDYRRQDYLRG
jgi:hypothetical protein